MTVGIDVRNELLMILDANDIVRLKNYPYSDEGLVNDEIRERAWPILLGINPFLDSYLNELYKQNVIDWMHLDPNTFHKDADQVQKDVDRSFNTLYSTSSCYHHKGKSVEDLKKRLFKLIMLVLKAIPQSNYYQGYHDVALMALLHFSDDCSSFKFLYMLTLKYLRDHMMSGIHPTIVQLNLIPDIMKQIDFQFYLIIQRVNPIYALSSIISLFTHEIENYQDVSIIWDSIFLNDDPQLPIYLYAALLIYYKEDIIMDLTEICDSSGEINFDFDVDIVHSVLSKFIKKNLSINSIDTKHEVYKIIQLSLNLRKSVPMSSLKSFKHIYKNSFLKCTSGSLTVFQSLADEYHRYEMKQLRKKKHGALIKRNKNNMISLLKISAGVGILGIILHVTFKQPTRFGIESNFAKAYINVYQSIREYI